MLVDPRHNLTLDWLIDWLRTQPPDEQYFYSRGKECLCARALTAAGFTDVETGSISFGHSEGKLSSIPAGWDEIARGDHITFSHQTYGHALKRALAYRERQRAAA